MKLRFKYTLPVLAAALSVNAARAQFNVKGTVALDNGDKAIGATLRERFGGWKVFLLTSDRGLPGQLGLREDRKTPLFNGAIECRLFEFSMRQRG